MKIPLPVPRSTAGSGAPHTSSARPARSASPAEASVPTPVPGQVPFRTRMMAVAAALRTRMPGVRLSVASFRPGEAMGGAAVGAVAAEVSGRLTHGEFVQHPGGWRECAAAGADRVRRLGRDALPGPVALRSQGLAARCTWCRAVQLPAGAGMATGAAGSSVQTSASAASAHQAGSS